MQLQHVTFEANFQVQQQNYTKATCVKNKNLKHLYLSELQFLPISLYFASISDPFEIEEIEK